MYKNFEPKAVDLCKPNQPLMKKIVLPTYSVERTWTLKDVNCMAYLNIAFNHKVDNLRMARLVKNKKRMLLAIHVCSFQAATAETSKQQ